jgi:hypothetical protein
MDLRYNLSSILRVRILESNLCNLPSNDQTPFSG